MKQITSITTDQPSELTIAVNKKVAALAQEDRIAKKITIIHGAMGGWTAFIEYDKHDIDK